MKFSHAVLAIAIVSANLAGHAAVADDEHHDHDHHAYVEHQEWRRGAAIRHEDWDRGERVDDYRRYHLSRPPRGYEWRSVDGHYILANPSNFQIRANIRIP